MAQDPSKLTFLLPCCADPRPLTRTIFHNFNEDSVGVEVQCQHGGMALNVDGLVTQRCLNDERHVVVSVDFRTSIGPKRNPQTRVEKIAAAMAGIREGKHLEPQVWLKTVNGGEGSVAISPLEAFVRFIAAQRTVAPSMLSPATKEACSAEWSRRLREKVTASKRKETHQVLCDLQDEP